MKVLVFNTFTQLGGSQIAANRVAAGLSERGHDVRLAFLYAKDAFDTLLPHDVMLDTARPGLAGYLRIAARTFAYVRRERPDAILSFLPLASVIAQGAGLMTGVPGRVVSYRTTLDSAHPVMRWLDVACAWGRVYTSAIFVAEAVKATAPHHPAGFLARSAVVHNGLWDFAPSPLGRPEARARFGEPADAFTLVAVGRLHAQKNNQVLIRTMAGLPDCRLLIAGDGPEREALARLVEETGTADRVRFLGSVARADVPHLLAAADVLVHGSLFEGQSNTVLEALAAGLPVVVHDIPEQREVLQDAAGRVYGTLVPVDDVPAWQRAIRRLKDDPAARSEAARLAVERSRAFTFGAMIDGFERVLRSTPPRTR
jgi:glycosyltransferase involved in cell wall biosynthesis